MVCRGILAVVILLMTWNISGQTNILNAKRRKISVKKLRLRKMPGRMCLWNMAM